MIKEFHKENRCVRVRFAPSPTGELHVGNARTALFNYLFARRHGGRLILRMEDTDAERTSSVFESHIMEDLAWLGLDWDEGPDIGGTLGPYRQSERFALYREHLERLAKDGAVYACYCTDEELEQQRREMIARRQAPRYPGTCRKRSRREKEALEREGRRSAWRFAVPEETIAFRDMIRGVVRFRGSALGDFIIVRSSGAPAYNFACVVDDRLMEITHVIRGEDHLTNTALQMLLYRALHWRPPMFAHHALILGKDRTKFSKRHGDVAIREYRERGIMAEALVNYLALLGSSLGEGREIATLEEIIAAFDLRRAGRSGAVFDEDKLRWLNGLYIHNAESDVLLARLEPFIRKAGYDLEKEGELIRGIVKAFRDNLTTLADIGDGLAMFDDGRFYPNEEARAVLADPEARTVVEAMQSLMDSLDDNAVLSYADLVERLAHRTGKRGRDLFLPLRAALTGRTKGPEMEKIFSLLGRKSIIDRLSRTLA